MLSSSRLLAVLCASAVAGKGPESYFKPNTDAGNRQRLEQQVHQLMEAEKVGGKEASAALNKQFIAEEAARSATAVEAARNKPTPWQAARAKKDAAAASAAAPAEPAAAAEPAAEAPPPPAAAEARGARRGLLAGFSGRARVPVPVVLAGAVGCGAWRLARSRGSSQSRAIGAELEAITRLCGAAPEAAPKGAAGLAELRARRELLASRVMPLLAQLEQAPAPSLAKSSAAELEVLSASLAARVESCATVLTDYHALGQDAPPDFRSWPVATLEARHVNMTLKAPLLRELVSLEARLGRIKLDWSVPEWSAERLSEHCEKLAAALAESGGRKAKAALIGKVEAAMWVRKQEPPIGLPTMELAELEALYAQLTRGPSPASGAEAGMEPVDDFGAPSEADAAAAFAAAAAKKAPPKPDAMAAAPTDAPKAAGAKKGKKEPMSEPKEAVKVSNVKVNGATPGSSAKRKPGK